MAERNISDEERLNAIATEAAGCTRCPLYRGATQTVFGEGPANAPLLALGEQPGDKEDLAGRPFVGPAGRVFDEAVAEAGLDRSRIYVTNAVKHFKNEPRGKRRIHKKPSVGEIQACRWWLGLELEIVAPRIVLAMGATALRAMLEKPVTLGDVRGTLIEAGNAPPVFATVHPSFLIRIPDRERRAEERARFTEDLRQVGKLIEAG